MGSSRKSRRWDRVPSALWGALAASLAVHLLGAGVLSTLPVLVGRPEAPSAEERSPMAIELVASEEPASSRRAEASDGEEGEDERRPREDELPTRRVQPEPDPPPAEEAALERARREIAPPAPDTRRLQPVQIRSADPEVEPPEDARFVADEASRVEEETVATLRSYSMDAPEVEPARPIEASEAEEEGNADIQESAEHREREGSESRFATEQEARRERRADEEPRAALPNTQAGRADEAQGSRPAASGAQAQGSERAQREGGGERWETVTLSDGEGTFTVRRRVRPEGEGQGGGGGPAREAHSGRRGRHGERLGQRGHRGSRRGQRGPDLRLSWNQFEQVLGEDRLREERERFARERLSKQRGRSEERQRRWADFRAAIENYVSDVRPGNQTALNAAASPFASYIATVHRRLHRHFAERFIANLPGGAGNPFNDMSLRTKLEIVFNGDGSIHRVGVVRTSGLLPFDYGAYNAVMSGQPYPAPPESIRSGNGKVYLHWSFYRNARQCGAFNAEPFILPNPPGTPAGQDDSPFVDGQGPAWGGVVPRDARPSWGVERGQGSGGEEAEPGPAR